MKTTFSLALLCWMSLSAAEARAQAIGQTDRIDREDNGQPVMVSIPRVLAGEIASAYPEGIAQIPQSPNGPSLLVTDDGAQVTVVFFSENAVMRNLFGYFLYTVDAQNQITILERQLILPSVALQDPNTAWGDYGGTGELVTGLQATLRDGNGDIRRFNRGDRIGFFLISDGWRTGPSTGGPSSGPAVPYLWPLHAGVALPAADPAQNHDDVEGVNALTTLDAINPENARGHSDRSRHGRAFRHDPVDGLFGGRQFWILGMEDLDRAAETPVARLETSLASDDDFNDVVFLVDGPVAVDAEPPRDECINDAFPGDPWRCTVESASGTLIYEDNYPFIGDADYDDVVISYTCQEARNAANAVTDIACTYNLYASGAAFEHDFGVAINQVPYNTTGELRVEYFPSFIGATPVAAPPPFGFSARLSDYVMPTPDPSDAPNQASVRLRHLFHGTRSAFNESCDGYGNGESFFNSFPTGTRCRSAAVRVVVSFDRPIPDANIAQAPYDPFIEVTYTMGTYDIHLPGTSFSFAGSQDFPALPAGGEVPADRRPQDLDPAYEYRFMQGVQTNESEVYYYPWALHIPTQTPWRYAQERYTLGLTFTPAPHSGATPLAFNTYPGFDQWVGTAGQMLTTWYLNPDLTKVIADPEMQYVTTQPWSVGFGIPGGVRTCNDTSPADGRCDSTTDPGKPEPEAN